MGGGNHFIELQKDGEDNLWIMLHSGSRNLGYKVAIKTGTPQVTGRVQDSTFIGFAPADDPKIAFAGIIEGGEYSKYMIRSILKLYEEVYGDMNGTDTD